MKLSLIQILQALKSKKIDKEINFQLEIIQLYFEITFNYGEIIELIGDINQIAAFRQALAFNYGIASITEINKLTGGELRSLAAYLQDYRHGNVYQ